MFSWIKSRLKRYKVVQKPKAKAAVPAVIRSGKRLHRCTILDVSGSRAMVELQDAPLLRFPDYIDVRIDADQTFRRAKLRWQHNSQISVDLITPWAIAR